MRQLGQMRAGRSRPDQHFSFMARHRRTVLDSSNSSHSQLTCSTFFLRVPRPQGKGEWREACRQDASQSNLRRSLCAWKLKTLFQINSKPDDRMVTLWVPQTRVSAIPKERGLEGMKSSGSPVLCLRVVQGKGSEGE